MDMKGELKGGACFAQAASEQNPTHQFFVGKQNYNAQIRAMQTLRHLKSPGKISHHGTTGHLSLWFHRKDWKVDVVETLWAISAVSPHGLLQLMGEFKSSNTLSWGSASLGKDGISWFVPVISTERLRWCHPLLSCVNNSPGGLRAAFLSSFSTLWIRVGFSVRGERIQTSTLGCDRDCGWASRGSAWGFLKGIGSSRIVLTAPWIRVQGSNLKFQESITPYFYCWSNGCQIKTAFFPVPQP